MKYNTSKKNTLSTNKLLVVAACSSIMLLLNGCAHKPNPQMLGITEVEWQTYDKAKQLNLLDSYRRMQAENEAEDKVDRAPPADQQPLAKGVNAAPVATTLLAPSALASKPSIEVTISGGSVLMPPFASWQPFAPATFTIQAATCEETLLTQLDGKAQISLRSCYKDNMLRLDPSRFDFSKKEGTVTIPRSSLWEQKFVYHGVNSDGYVKLKDVNVAVKQIN
jgi:hypothetical protein